jgi:ATP-grasp domain
MRPTVLVAATTWWPLSAQLAITLARHGCVVEALCPPGHPLRYVSGVRRCHRYRRVASLNALRRAIVAARPEIVIPCDDSVVWQLHQLYREAPELRALIERSIGSAEHFEVAASRQKLLQVARTLHIRVPRTERAKTHDDLRQWFEHPEDTVGMKQDGTWGGNGVHVLRSPSEAAVQLTSMLQPVPLSIACKRAIINHDPSALWSYKNLNEPVVTLQEFIQGRPATLMMACWQGTVLATVTAEVLWSQGATGAAVVVRLIDQPEMAQAACRLAKKLELSGMHGLDFMLEADTGAAYLIEMNPRCTQLGHLPMAGGCDLAGVLSQKLGASSPPAAEQRSGLREGETIAFFPKTFFWDPKSRYLREGYHDVPWEEPALLKELLKESWPNRQGPARLYHWLRPPKESRPEGYEESTPD